MPNSFVKTGVFSVFLFFILTLSPAYPAKEVPKPSSQSERSLEKYPIRAGDKINIQVYREKDLTEIFIVDSGGNINYPLLGTLYVQGLSLEELRQRLTDGLGKDYLVNPQVQVAFEESLNKFVYILGQVAKPGNYDYTPNMTLVRLVSKAGGFTLMAASNQVKITRKTADGKMKTLSVNVDQIMNGGAEDVPLELGDLVMVPETFF